MGPWTSQGTHYDKRGELDWGKDEHSQAWQQVHELLALLSPGSRHNPAGRHVCAPALRYHLFESEILTIALS
jgi:hypothetical protein